MGIQEKKNSRLLQQENTQYGIDKVEYEQKLNDANTQNAELIKQNEKLNDRFKTLQKAYDELNKNFIDQESKLEKVNGDYKELAAKYKILLQKEKRKTLDDTSNYKKWSYHDIVYWISYLEAGRFEKYEELFLQNMKKENVKGLHLTDLDKHDIHRLGCTDYGDKKALLAHFQLLGK